MIELNIIGYVGQDATTEIINGKQVIKFSVCHSETFKTKDNQQVENSQWVTCSYWSESKVHEWIKKGTLIYVSGKPNVKPFIKDRNELDVHFNLNVHDITLLQSPKQNNNNE
jgi:single-strand DNA-binding protein